MENSNSHLASFNSGNLNIPNPKQNVISWQVKTEGGAYIGSITDLLYDTNAMTVRYLIIDLTDNGMNLDGKKVMIPVGIASLHPSDNEIVLPNVHSDQFILLPDYLSGEVNTATEQQIRNIIGSPAALRLEETIAEYDQQQFYAHHHFNENNFYRKTTEIDSELGEERIDERTTINGLIENSLNENLHAADEETGANSHHNEGKKIDEKTRNSDSSSFIS
ncbi:MAG: PRC-barrel domain containing protein [Pedobacter sp.]|nr:MAG: PRC-barrel domain containing protein [Pedobacter sp.]